VSSKTCYLDGSYLSAAPIHLAAANGRAEVVEVLALAGAHVEAYDKKERTAFDIAAIGGHMNTLQVRHSTLGMRTVLTNSNLLRYC
jgi:hypothetical protein